MTSLAEDVKVAYNTVRSWLETLERLYLVFTLTPWSRRVARAPQKARKLYLLDYPVIEGTAFRTVSNGDHTVLVAPASLWLPRLP